MISAAGLLAEAEEVMALMRTEPLCQSFLDLADGPEDRPFEGEARYAVLNPEWNKNGSDAPKWIAGDPIYPDRPEARRFFGNFATVSRVFTIDTDDQELIERLREAIRENLARVQGGAA